MKSNQTAIELRALPALEARRVGGGAAAGEVRAYEELVVNAADDAGEFSLTIRRGRVVSATMSGSAVPASRLRQEGRDIQILGEDGGVLLALEFELPGTLRWEPRPRATERAS